jgi:hypothetical protein
MFIRLQKGAIASRSDENAFIYRLKQFPALKTNSGVFYLALITEWEHIATFSSQSIHDLTYRITSCRIKHHQEESL